MSKRKVAGPGAPGDGEATRKLTYREERFIEAYIDNGGNATQAYLEANPRSTYGTCNTEGPKMLVKPGILEAIEAERARLRGLLGFNREKALMIYIGMATAKLSDFAEVLKKPDTLDSYAGLKEKEYALQSAKKSYKNGNEIKLVDRKAAVDALWEKLGLGKEAGGRSRETFLDAILALAGSTRKESEGG